MPRKKPTDDPADQLQIALGGTGDRLPGVGLDTLRRFHAYLTAQLSFPFDGRQSDPVGPHRDTRSPLRVVRLLDPVREYAPEEMYGLICKAQQNGERIELPLDRIDVPEGSPPHELLELYRNWLHGYQ